MKKGIFLLSLFLLFGFAYGQNLSTGPAAKNQAAWEKNKKNTVVYFDANPENAQGIEAKNSKTWNQNSSKLKIRTRKEIHNPKGLEAKNWKPWKEYSAKNTNSKAAYIIPKGMRKKKIWFH
ncbi:hypothetical protein [Algoriphagus limi]|uniref:Uncharacterized protein n=1 Tax=Algoriphagus limi TaxID=2975273 RepID=A0ABT2G558_9BACT|nr:hypothetical protein [Algoriphagus limi]MCS5490412.1 hypothetical protein [Algoriphagus limi]